MQYVFYFLNENYFHLLFFTEEEYAGGKYYFCCVKEGNHVMFSSDDEMDRQMWVHKISQATGQSHRPIAPKTLSIGTPKTNSLTRLMGGNYSCYIKLIVIVFIEIETSMGNEAGLSR